MKILDELLTHRTCSRVIRLSYFTQKFDILRNSFDVDTLADCEKLLLVNCQIVGMESHLLRTYDKFLSELLELAYSELNRLLDKLKFVL